MKIKIIVPQQKVEYYSFEVDMDISPMFLDGRSPEAVEEYIENIALRKALKGAGVKWDLIPNGAEVLASSKPVSFPSKDSPSRREWNRVRPLLSPIVMASDGYACRECGSKADLTVDHIQPISKGGTNELYNLRTLCNPCNSRKGARI